MAVGLALVSSALAIGGLLLLLRRIVAPVRLLTEVIGRTAQGDLAVEVPCRGRDDEISQMAMRSKCFASDPWSAGGWKRRRQSSVNRKLFVPRSSKRWSVP